MVMSRRAGLALLSSLLLAAACSQPSVEPDAAPSDSSRLSSPQASEVPGPVTDNSFIIYYDPSQYNERAAGSALEACLKLPGTAFGPQADSQPPIQTVLFSGSASARGVVEECLRRVPAADVTKR